MTWDRWALFQGCWIVGKIHTQWKFVRLSPNSDFSYPLRCYHNEHGGISHHQLFHCLLNHSCTDQIIKNESSRSLAFVRGIHPWPVDSSQKEPVTPQMFSFDDIIMIHENTSVFFLSLGFRSEAWKKMVQHWFRQWIGTDQVEGFFLVQSLIYPLPSQMLCYIELLFNIELCDKDTPCDTVHIHHAMWNEVCTRYCRVSQGSLWSKMHVFWFTAGLFWENMSLSCSLELIDLISQKLSFW